MVDPALQRSALVQERTRGDLRPPGGVAWQPQVPANHSGTAGESGQNLGSSSRFTDFFPAHFIHLSHYTLFLHDEVAVLMLVVVIVCTKVATRCT